MSPLIAAHFLTEAGAFSTDDRRSFSRKLFDAEFYLPLLRGVAGLVGPQRLQQELGIAGSEFNALVAGGMLQPASTGRKLNEPWRLSEGKTFLEGLQALVTQDVASEAGWQPISLSVRRTWVPLAGLIDAIRKHDLTLARQVGEKGYHALRLERGPG